MNETLFEEYNDDYIRTNPKGMSEFNWDRVFYEIAPTVAGVEKKKRGITNERQAIIKEIADIIKLESGAVNAKLLAIKLSHIPTQDLYFMLSEGKDYRNRTGNAFGKYIYGSIKVKLDNPNNNR